MGSENPDLRSSQQRGLLNKKERNNRLLAVQAKTRLTICIDWEAGLSSVTIADHKSVYQDSSPAGPENR